MSSSAIRRAAAALPANAQVATAQVFALQSNSAMAAVIAAPGKLILEGKRFKVRAEGNLFTAVGTTTAKPQILAALTLPSSPLTIGSWTALAAGAGVASPTTGCPWWAEADLIFDSFSGLLHGTFAQLVNNTAAAAAAITPVTGINATNNTVTQGATPVPPADPVIWFAAAMTFNAAGAQAANLMNFELQY